MTKPNFRTVILVAALAAVTATAWAMNETNETAAPTVTPAPRPEQGQ